MNARKSSRTLRVSVVAVLALLAGQVHADAGWFESGDTQLRLDLQLLNDAEVIRYPSNQWPIPRAALQYAFSNAKEHLATNSAVMAALDRLRARLEPRERTLAFDTAARGGEPGLLRDFDTVARESGELSAGLRFDSGMFSLGLRATGVNDPSDGQEIRADGSHATLKLANWLVSANALDRWWGPGHESSLILSSNARPMPTVMVERAEARPFESKWLSWLGPWRFSFGVSQMEDERADIDKPLFMAWRVVIMPFRKLEIGFSRTAQFCGEQLACDLDVFGNMLAGNDNVGIDATPENEPGNQMAGFDLRWNSPIGNLPYALYGQYIGEDESSYLPAKYLGQLGLEVWHPFSDGAIVQGFLEYASTTCSGLSRSDPYYGCAYNQGRFNVEGYRYRGRSIGHTSDRDADNWAVGGIYTGADGSVWTATARSSRLNRDDFGDLRNTVATVPTNYRAIELGWKGKLLGERIFVDLGLESIEPDTGGRDRQAFGFISWQHEFQP